MEDTWVKVYSADNEYAVEIVKGLLDESGIESVILNRKDSEFLIGEVELYVENKDFTSATEIIAGKSE